MPRTRQSRRDTAPAGLPRRWAWAGRGLLVFVAVSVLVGCQQDNRMASMDRDPLVGSQPALPPRTPPPAAPTAQVTSNPLPAPPPAFAPASQTSPAALAAGTPANFDHSQDLHIGNAPSGPSQDLPPTTLPPANPGVTLRQPEIPPTPARLDTNVTPTAAVAVGSQPATYEQLRSQLVTRGVTDMRLETWGTAGAWKFTCSLPNRQDPNKRRTYEAQAQDDLSAMRAVLEQMDRDK